MFCAMFHMVMKIKKSNNALQAPSVLPECLTIDVIEKLGTKIQKTVKQKRTITQTKTIRVENPNKNKKKKQQQLSNADTTIKTKEKEKEIGNDMDFGNDDWGNGFSFDTKSPETTEQNGTTSPPQNDESVTKEQIATTTTQNGATEAAAGDDDNWNAFGSFFDDQ